MMNSLSFCLLECFYLFFIYDVKFLLCIIFFVGRFFFYSLSTLTISSCFLLACEKYVGSPIVGPFYLMSYSFLLLLSKFSLCHCLVFAFCHFDDSIFYSNLFCLSCLGFFKLSTPESLSLIQDMGRFLGIISLNSYPILSSLSETPMM